MNELDKPKQRLTDDELIDAHLDETDRRGFLGEERLKTIGHACSRVIASQYHEGATSAFYAFASTGAIRDGFFTELERSLAEVKDDEIQTRRLEALADYALERIFDRTLEIPMDGWSRLWLRQPSDEVIQYNEVQA